jgi:hypothetical protein
MKTSMLRPFATVSIVLGVTLGGGLSLFAESAVPDTILPAGEYDDRIKSPADFFGFKMGDRHLRHYQLVDYFEYLDQVTELAVTEEYARSHGTRPLLNTIITSTRNQGRLEAILAKHRQLCLPSESSDVDTAELPAVIYMGYSVHGDESSGANAVPLVAYYLTAGPGRKLLDDIVVVIDPCLNPDGFDRFAAWANANRGKKINADPAHREHNQPWPGGRVNYYFFDLNRDWMPLQHPESQGRAQVFYRFRPNVVVDFHEMGTNSTFFFQPGVPTRNYPTMPRQNLELTRQISKYHAQALDEIGSLYYTEERFDDFYMGKGSTYPDLHGSVGILFEQASSRGHVQESIHGDLTFRFTIRNQFTTSLSTLNAVQDMRVQLVDYQREFYQDSLSLAKTDKTRVHVFRAPDNPPRLDAFELMLKQHDIQLRRVDGAVYVPTEQPEYRFLASLFDERTTFEENIFYDVSTWNMAFAFGLEHEKLQEIPPHLQDHSREDADPVVPVSAALTDGVVGVAIDWRNDNAQSLLYRLLDEEVIAKVAEKEFVAGDRRMPIGTVIVPYGIQQDKQEVIAEVVAASAANGLSVVPIDTGLTDYGIDLGSSSFRIVNKPVVLLVTGNGVDRYQSGAIWHFFDDRLAMPITLIDADRLGSVDLGRYTCLIMPQGSYSSVSERATKKITDWVSGGGTLLTINSAINWAAAKGLVAAEFTKKPAAAHDGSSSANDGETTQQPYALARDESALQLISGAILETRIDRTHPICYGFTSDRLAVFRTSTLRLNPSRNPYCNPAVYTLEPQLAGYASDENLEKLQGSAAVTIADKGSGRVVMIADDPTFRAFWYGTQRLVSNTAFFGSLIEEPPATTSGHGH